MQRSEVRKGAKGVARGDCRCARWAHWFGGERNSLCAQRAQLQNSRNSHLTQGAGEIFLGERAEQLLRSASVATEGSSGWMGHMAEGVPILRPHHLHFASPRGGHDVPVLSLQNKIDPLSGRSYAGARRSALGVAGRRVSVWRSRCCWACGQSHMKRWQFVLIYLALSLGIWGAIFWVARTHDIRSPPHDPFWAKTVFIGSVSAVSISAVLLSTFAIKLSKAHWPIAEGFFAGALLLYFFGPDPAQRLLGYLFDNKYAPIACLVLIVVFFATSIQSTISAIRGLQIGKTVVGVLISLASGTSMLFLTYMFLFFE